MQFLALVLGTFEIPDGGAAWRERAIDGSQWSDWPDDGPLFSAPAAVPTVGALLDGAVTGDASFLEAAAEGGRVEVSGVLVGEQAILRWHATIAAALREVAAAGGAGEAAIVLPALGGATRIAVTRGKKGKGKSTVEQVTSKQLIAVAALAVVAIQLDGWIQAKEREPARTRAQHREGEARYWLAAPTEAETAALARARALTDAQLAAALADGNVLAPRLEPLASRFD